MLVDTIEGPIERDLLDVKDIIEEGPNCRSIATEWRFEGRLVKRDCHVMILSGAQMGGEQAKVG